jgi:U3 small nucleolar RNA-associated protein 14
MNFDKNDKNKYEKGKKEKGIMNMKFMKQAEAAEKSRLKEQSRQLI